MTNVIFKDRVNTIFVLPHVFASCAEKGWIDNNVFLEWFRSFITSIPQRPLLVVCDGHRSHVTLAVIHLARAHNVTIIKFPSHTTQLLQPLDVAVFKSIKSAWDKALVKHQRATRFRILSKAETVNLLCSVWNVGTRPETILSGFRATGVFPPCRNKYPVSKFNPIQYQSYLAQKALPPQNLPSAVEQSLPQNLPPAVEQILPQNLPPAVGQIPLQHPAPHELTTLSVQLPQRLSTASSASTSGLQEFFLSRCIATRALPVGELAIKRRRIQQEAAVITHEQFTKAVEDVQRLAAVKKLGRPKTVKALKQLLTSSGVDEAHPVSDDEVVPILPTFPVPKNRGHSPKRHSCRIRRPVVHCDFVI